MSDSTVERKRSHFALCAHEDVAFRRTTLLEEVELVHRALPELDADAVDLSLTLLGKTLRTPILIGAMTGGTRDDGAFNRDLATAAQSVGCGLCLGSMRPALQDPALRRDFTVRDAAPDILLLANIGGNQLAQFGAQPILAFTRDIGADALTVHLNAGMELIQPGGDRRFTGIAQHIRQLVDEAGDLPVVVKETGMGLSWQDGQMLRDAGVRCVEVGGAGGTSWVGVETLRAEGRNRRLGQMLWDFGIPSAASCAWMVDAGLEVICGGGVLSGLDAARALSLGARAVAVARPVLLAHAAKQREGVEELLGDLTEGLRYTMVCCGAKDLAALPHVPKVLGSRLTRYIEAGWTDR